MMKQHMILVWLKRYLSHEFTDVNFCVCAVTIDIAEVYGINIKDFEKIPWGAAAILFPPRFYPKTRNVVNTPT